MQLIWEAVTKILSEGGLLRKQWGLDWVIRWQHDVLVSLYSHDAFTRKLTQPAFWTCVQDIFRGKIVSLWLLESLTGSPEPRRALSGWFSDRIQMLLECGRGQHRSVEASQQHWLIGVRMKLGVTFLDCDPSFCLIFFPPNALTLPSHRVCCHGVSRRLCFMLSAETAWSSAGSVTLKSGTLPHLCWALMKSFTFI